MASRLPFAALTFAGGALVAIFLAADFLVRGLCMSLYHVCTGLSWTLAAILSACPVGRWVALDELFRYVRAHYLGPTIERSEHSSLYVGWSMEAGWLEYAGTDYWDVVVGTYLRAVLWEYVATLGLIDIAYTYPEDSARDVGGLYGFDDEYLSRYDGLLGVRLTPLGAYVLGLFGDSHIALQTYWHTMDLRAKNELWIEDPEKKLMVLPVPPPICWRTMVSIRISPKLPSGRIITELD